MKKKGNKFCTRVKERDNLYFVRGSVSVANKWKKKVRDHFSRTTSKSRNGIGFRCVILTCKVVRLHFTRFFLLANCLIIIDSNRSGRLSIFTREKLFIFVCKKWTCIRDAYLVQSIKLSKRKKETKTKIQNKKFFQSWMKSHGCWWVYRFFAATLFY